MKIFINFKNLYEIKFLFLKITFFPYTVNSLTMNAFFLLQIRQSQIKICNRIKQKHNDSLSLSFAPMLLRFYFGFGRNLLLQFSIRITSACAHDFLCILRIEHYINIAHFVGVRGARINGTIFVVMIRAHSQQDIALFNVQHFVQWIERLRQLWINFGYLRPHTISYSICCVNIAVRVCVNAHGKSVQVFAFVLARERC